MEKKILIEKQVFFIGNVFIVNLGIRLYCFQKQVYNCSYLSLIFGLLQERKNEWRKNTKTPQIG